MAKNPNCFPSQLWTHHWGTYIKGPQCQQPGLHEYLLAESLIYAKSSTKEHHENIEQLKTELKDLINYDDSTNTNKITDIEVQLATIEDTWSEN